MERLNTNEAELYPFTMDENSFLIKTRLAQVYREAIDLLGLNRNQKQELFTYTWNHFKHAEVQFTFEEKSRLSGQLFADLPYHSLNHAVYQISFDMAVTLKTLLQVISREGLSLTVEGVATALATAPEHDAGYVSQGKIKESFAKRRPVHVRESINFACQSLNLIKPPTFLDQQKMMLLAPIGIGATEFPFDEKVKTRTEELIGRLNPVDRAEGGVLRSLFRLVDLGGQVARRDYYPKGLRLLRSEYEAEEERKGLNLIGTDEEIPFKCRGFMEGVVIPTLGPIAEQLLGLDNYYQKAWQNLLAQTVA